MLVVSSFIHHRVLHSVSASNNACTWRVGRLAYGIFEFVLVPGIIHARASAGNTSRWVLRRINNNE
jgi:hypothetical protein